VLLKLLLPDFVGENHSTWHVSVTKNLRWIDTSYSTIFSLLSSHYVWYEMAVVVGRTSSYSPLSMFYTSVLNLLDYHLLVLMICDDLESFCWLRNLLPALTHCYGDCYAYMYVLVCFRWAVCRAVVSSGWNMWVGFNWAVHLEQKDRGICGVFPFVYRCRDSSRCMILLQHVSANIKWAMIRRTRCQREIGM
jgi:hypothetical protein